MITLSTDTFTLIASAAVLLISLLTPLSSPFLRFRRRQQTDHNDLTATTESGSLPALSLILSPQDDVEALARNLPHYLSQDYPAGFQVIIVIDQGDHDMEAAISQIDHLHRQEHPQSHARLYVTRMPRSSRYISKKKLAITLGVKAATAPWIVLAEATCRPASPHWLSSLASHCADPARLVTGVTLYADDTPAYRRFERLYMAHYLMREYTVGTAYRSDHGNLMMRKADFLDREGFLGNLHLMRGEYDFLVNTHARPGDTALVADPEAWLIEDCPTDKQWYNRHIFYLETRRYLMRSLSHRLPIYMDQALLHLDLLLITAAAAVAGLTARWLLLASAVAALIAMTALRAVISRRGLRAFDEPMPGLAAVACEVSLAWRHLGYLLRHRRADRRDFTTHKL